MSGVTFFSERTSGCAAKWALCRFLFIKSIILSACGDDNGTYYLPNDEINANLEKNGYVVVLY